MEENKREVEDEKVFWNIYQKLHTIKGYHPSDEEVDAFNRCMDKHYDVVNACNLKHGCPPLEHKNKMKKLSEINSCVIL